MMEIRMFQAEAGRAKRFGLFRDGKEVASLTTKKPMTVEEACALFAPEKSSKREKK